MRKMKNAATFVLPAALVALIMGISYTVHSQYNFDPKSVQPKNYSKENYNLGYIPMTQAQKDALMVATPMVSDVRNLPSKADLSSKMPPVGNQGTQGSCVGWASTYGIKSYHEKRKRKWDYGTSAQAGGKGDHVFSPAWTYNQINGGRDYGSNPYSALTLLQNKGAVPWSLMPYNVNDYRRQPSQSMFSTASKYKITSFRALNVSSPSNIKLEIVNGNPVLGGVKIYDNFFKIGSQVYDHGSGAFKGGHAIVIVGYDDSKRSPYGHVGAYKIFNSWGTYWGTRGFGWVSYKAFAGSMGLGAFSIHDSTGADSDKKPDTTEQITAPSTVTASRGTFADRIMVSWSQVENAVAYRVERAVGDSNSFDYLANVQGTSYSDYRIQANLNFKYRVITIGSESKSNPEDSPVAEGFALTQKNRLPSRVVGFSGRISGSSTSPSVYLSWQPAAAADKYKIVRYNTSRKSWPTLATVTGTTYTDANPYGDQANYYYVQALNSAGAGQWSDSVRVYISKKSGGPPGRVYQARASEGAYQDRIVVTWKTEPAATYYGVYRYNYSKNDWDKYFTSRTTTILDRTSTIRSGQPFVYAIKAFNNYGSSSQWSNYATGYTRSGSHVQSGVTLKPPKTVKSRVNEKQRMITLTWSRAEGATGYDLYRKKEGSNKFKLITSLPSGKLTFTEKIPGIPGEIYLYTVRSKGQGGAVSKNSKVVVGFINREEPRVMTSFVPGEGINNFVGTWKAMHWEAGKKPTTIMLVIKGKEDKFAVAAVYGKSNKKIFTGSYAAKSRYLESGRFRLQLLEAFDNDIAQVEIDPGALIPSKINLNFARQKQ